MPEETAVMEPTQETEPDDLDSFDYTKYVACFPDGTEEYYADVFRKRAFGWKSRARTVLRLAAAHETVKAMEEELVTLSQTIPRSHGPARVASITPREGLRAFLTSLPDDKLQQLCAEKSVSWASFMPESHPDKPGLIDALCDAMLG